MPGIDLIRLLIISSKLIVSRNISSLYGKVELGCHLGMIASNKLTPMQKYEHKQ